MDHSITEEQTSPIVKRGKGFHLISRPGSKNLIIYFSGTGKRNGKFDFWASGQKINANVLFVSDGLNHWYQQGIQGLGTTTEQTVESIKGFADTVGAERIFTVGASMGGYGAILYASLLGGQALAFSFDSVLKLPTSPSEKHMPEGAPIHYPDIVPLVESTNTRIHIYAGEMYTMDIVGALRMANLPSVTIDTLRGVDHSSARFVNLSAGLNKVITAFMEGRPLPRFREIGYLTQQPDLVGLLHEAHLHFTNNDMTACKESCRTALSIDPYSEAAHYLIGRAYLLTRKLPAAARHLGYVAAALPDFEDGQFYFANALRAARRYHAAEDLFSRQTIKWPKSSRGQYNLSLAQEAIGAFGDARKSMRQAVELEPRFEPKEAEMLSRLEAKEETETRALNPLARVTAPKPASAASKKPIKKTTTPKRPKKKTLYGRAKSAIWKMLP
ncbi:hypothetical protein OIU34_11725 [Pararhizobium sp. BT-229]|uniref:tetratricopeptide repeat protein n=1 Tax=Pararhizobium sp. BT-229 TaxID=2986923 RepID=UPI0021F7CE4D|nr:hypothetical protein [Pararhizobium sp. BT-229]MCV9962568.1 hypothetical protein [Pararhizobium sp. BT-229]